MRSSGIIFERRLAGMGVRVVILVVVEVEGRLEVLWDLSGLRRWHVATVILSGESALLGSVSRSLLVLIMGRGSAYSARVDRDGIVGFGL